MGHVAFLDTRVIGETPISPQVLVDTRSELTWAGPVWLLPGLINSHDHLEFNTFPRLGEGPYADYRVWGREIHERHAEVIQKASTVPPELRAEVGVLRNLLAGVTAVVDHGERPWRSRTVQILRDYRFAHAADTHCIPWRALLAGPGPEPFLLHAGEGTTDESRRDVLRFLAANWSGRPVVAVHGVALRPGDFNRLAALVWCPVANANLLGAQPDVAAAEAETCLLFGTDSTLSAVGDFWSQLRFAAAVADVPPRDLLSLVTTRARHFWGAEEGATLVLRRWSEDVLDSRPEDVLLVTRGTDVLLADAELGLALSRGTYEAEIRIGAQTKRVATNIRDFPRKLEASGISLEQELLRGF